MVWKRTVFFLKAMVEKRVKSGSADFELFFSNKETEYLVLTETGKAITFRISE